MKRGIRICVVALTFALLVFFSPYTAVGQQLPPMQYRIHWVDIPVNYNTLSLRGMNDSRVITGYSVDDSIGLLTGFVYDLSDEANPVYYDLRTHLNIPALWIENWGKHINNSGMGVAIVEDATGYRRGIWFDMATAAWDYVPEPTGGTFSNQIQINNYGDIVVGFSKPDDTDDFYVYNPDPIAGYAPIYGGFDAWVVRISDSGHVVGELSAVNVIDEYLFRWFPGDLEPDVLDYQTFREFGVVNGLGEIAGTYWNSTIAGAQSSFEVFRYRNVNDFDFLPVETAFAKGFNDSGDVAGILDDGERKLEAFQTGTNAGAFLYQDEYGLIRLDDIVIGVDSQFFLNAEISFDGSLGSVLTNRDSTDFGSIFGSARMTTTTGKGKNMTTTTETRSFVLIPELLEPDPGISVDPVAGLVTTEGGGFDSFDVVLTTEPTANVTIGISSSDTTEGTVDVASLTFTPMNWDLPQTVTITGVDDLDADGNVEYTIVTAAAVSADPDYNGIDADDVAVTNLDDESPPVLIYHSSDTPIAIPDPGTRSSLIEVNENLFVAKVTVTVNIDHNRAQDMDVYLIAPDGTRVELFTDVGGNGDDFVNTTLDDDAATSITQGSAPFTGTFRPEGWLSDFVLGGTQGTWRLEVTDDSKAGGQNAAGTLLSWTLTIEAF